MIKDDFLCFRAIYFLKGKAETAESFEDFFKMVATQTGNKVISEITTEPVEELISKLGIKHQLSFPFSPQQNGKAERDI